MKKIFILTLIIGSFMCSATFAQVDKSFYHKSYESRTNGSFSQESSLLSFGYGFGNRILPSYGVTYNGYNRVGFGPVYAKYEHGFLRDEVGLGGEVSFGAGRIKYGPGDDYHDDYSAFSIGLLGYYHFNKLIPVKNLDVYAGGGVSFWNRSYRQDDGSNLDNDYSEADVIPIIKVGVRYYVKPSFGFYLEVGHDNMSSANLGVTFRL